MRRCTRFTSGAAGRRVFVLGAGYILVGRHRRLKLDEILAGVALVIWIIVDRISEGVLGANADPLKIWGIRGVLLLVMAALMPLPAAMARRRAKV